MEVPYVAVQKEMDAIESTNLPEEKRKLPVAIEVPGGNRIRRINIKAQHSAFSIAINRTVSYGLYMFIKSDVSS